MDSRLSVGKEMAELSPRVRGSAISLNGTYLIPNYVASSRFAKLSFSVIHISDYP